MKLKSILFLMALMLVAAPVFAQEGAAAASAGGFHLSTAFAMAIASGLCGLAQGKAISSAVEGMARNPSAGGAIRITLLLGLAFVESLALFTLISLGR
ncbi:MAG: ATP synthase F0 subunit C [Bryobacterales bacterium]|nr:ATP synthase F0 subunit C [Bryobacterales bacterium]